MGNFRKMLLLFFIICFAFYFTAISCNNEENNTDNDPTANPTPEETPEPTSLKGLGEVCGSGGECLSGHCVDGVCCDDPCAGICVACLANLTGGIDGYCNYILADSDPDNECAGNCDGSGGCQ